MADIPLLSGLFDKIEDYQREVIDDKMLGHGLRLASQGVRALPNSPDPASFILRGAMGLMVPDDKYSRYATGVGMTGKKWVDEAYKNSPWQHFLAGAIADPTNLIGFGLPGLAAKGAIKAPLIGKELATGLRAANVIDQLPGKVTGKTFDLGLGAGRKVLGTAADAIGPMIPHNPALDKIGNAYGKTLQGWREQALLSPAFHLNNYIGNMEAAVRSGQGDVIKATALAPFTGRSKAVDDILASIGNHRAPMTYTGPATPIDPASFGARWSDQTQKLGREPNINNPLTGPSVYRDIPDTYGPINAARDKFAGISEASKRFGQNRVEGPAIDAAFQKEFLPKFQENAQVFERELRGVTDNAGNPDPLAQRAADAFASSKGQMSPDDLREILYPGSRARRTAASSASPRAWRPTGTGRMPDWRDAVIGQWENSIIDAMEAGTKNSTGIFFDYTGKNPIDKLGQNTFAFHRFAVNNIPKTLRAAGKNPVYANVPAEYYRVSDDYNAQKGLPRAFHGKMPIGGPLPNGTQATFDPMGMSPFGMLVKAATRPSSTVDDKGTMVGEAFEDLKDIGLGLNPFIDTMLTATGQHGRSFAPGFLRASQPVNGILSAVMDRPVDIEGGPKELVGNVQEGLTGQRPFPYQEYLLRKRQAELKALGKDPKLAGQQLGDQMATEGLAGFVGVPGLKLLSPEEQSIRKNTALAQAYRLAGNQAGYRANPTARAYADLDPRDEMVANWNTLSAAERQRLLRDPEVRDQLLDKLAMQLHNTDSNARAPSPWLAKSAGVAGPSKRYVPNTHWDLGDPRKR